MKALIIGSGIAGLSAAVALRRVGIDVAVYERAPQLTEVGAGISLWANALRALEYLDAGDEVEKRAAALSYSELRCKSGRKTLISLKAETFEKAIDYAPFVGMIHRADLVDALAGCLPEGVARYGFECDRVETVGDKAVAHFKNGHSDEADLIVGADGIRSAVRSSLFGPQEPRYSGYTCWRGICPRPASLQAGYFGEWWGRGQRFGISSLLGDRVFWWAVMNTPQGGKAEDEHRAVSEAFREWAEPVPEMLATTPAADVFRNDIIDRPPTKVWSSGRSILVGDAAHPTTPNFGQGGCMAIEDSVVLARCLRREGDLKDKLAAFTVERYPRTSAITNKSWRFGRIGHWEGPVSCWLRDRLVGLALPLVGSGPMAKYASFDVGGVEDDRKT